MHLASMVNSIVPGTSSIEHQLLLQAMHVGSMCACLLHVRCEVSMFSVFETGPFIFCTGNVLHLCVSSAMSSLWDRLEV